MTTGSVGTTSSVETTDPVEATGPLGGFTVADAQEVCGYLHYLASTAVELELQEGANALYEPQGPLTMFNPPPAVTANVELGAFFDDYRAEVGARLDFYADYPTIGSLIVPDDLRAEPLVETFRTKWQEWRCAEVADLPISPDGTPHQGSLDSPADTPVRFQVQTACDGLLGALTGDIAEVAERLRDAEAAANAAANADSSWSSLAQAIEDVGPALAADPFDEASADAVVDRAVGLCAPFLEQYETTSG